MKLDLDLDRGLTLGECIDVLEITGSEPELRRMRAVVSFLTSRLVDPEARSHVLDIPVAEVLRLARQGALKKLADDLAREPNGGGVPKPGARGH